MISPLGKFALLLPVLVLFTFFFVVPQKIAVYAYESQSVGEGSEGELQKKLDENRKEQERIKKLLDETKQKKVTLQNEISYQENQIRLTMLKVEETKSEIEALTGQIDRLEGALNELALVFAERAAETYRLKRLGDTLALFLSANNLAEFFSVFNYLQRVQQNDRDLLFKMQSSQIDYEDRRTEVEKLQEKLKTEEAKLVSQKARKQNLLEVTKSDEKKYQELLATLQADEMAIQKALSSLIARIVAGIVTGSPISKGQPIGLEGNTGNVYPRPSSSCPQCGAHLHFMVMPCNVIENTSLSCHTDPRSYLNDGQYRKPLDFPRNWEDYVTQWYGYTSFAQSGAYGGAPHSGIDLITEYGGNRGGYGAPVYAIADGTVYYGTDSAGGKYALIKHRDDFWSAYWHLQ